MDRLPNLTGKKQSLAFELMHAFIGSWTLSELHESTEEALAKLFQADHVALCLMNPELPTGFDWKARTTGPFLQGYYQWFQEDFVFRRLSREFNTALSDTQMLRGQKLENTETYRRSREANLRLRHVLAVLIASERQEEGRGAVALYSDRAAAFSEEHRLVLQWLTPFLKSAFQNVTRFSSLEFRHRLLESLSLQTSASLVLTEQAKELFRTAPVTPLLEKWFEPSELTPPGIPRAWGERLAELVRTEAAPAPGQDTWKRHGPEADLKVTFRRLPAVEHRRLWELKVEELTLLPEAWRTLLTPRQLEVATCLLREGCTNEELARLLQGNRKAFSVQTVKKHLDAIYRKVGADGRADFISRALRP
jgi:DNA-binding CsgD family transcriptional regulator